MSETIIHSTAIVDPKAELGAGVSIGAHSIIESNVSIGDGTQIASNALIAWGAHIGKNVRVHHGAVIGTVPQDLKFGGEETTAEIGDNTVIREYVTVNRGTHDKWKTVVGSDCLLMAYSHVAHDCQVGDKVIMANSVNLGGHVQIGEQVIVGGIVPVHQFTRIGKHAIIGGGFRVVQDVCPYALAAGNPLRIVGLNHVGLSRRNFPKETLKVLKNVYKIIFFSKLNTSQALKRIEDEIEMIPEVIDIIDFIKSSKRGIVKA
ncbi:MAG: acyl-ACP--UDP-N-acetylglucosamine O-acyltransferase [candidate division Zixibacteria bacterium]|nr:acyl-ACP--UDP-N-acetylglucosamine O-acyltransferase [candidate division Zixibacteria bacterium]MBU1469529.1 acyl-ACP--UDP-N-acetylglucosamine O-acyltransferase [candidate division Zixibacteria bacterium]MBU2624569.1 acyl-ACP--UDP-N-acetylglucosamine O-acyltransferase [candidate division Zixibacteria bacterium]